MAKRSIEEKNILSFEEMEALCQPPPTLFSYEDLMQKFSPASALQPLNKVGGGEGESSDDDEEED